MDIRTSALAAVAAVALSGGAAQAVTYPTFEFDTVASSIVVSGADLCVFGNCELTAAFGSDAAGFSFSPTAEGQSVTLNDFIDWKIDLTGDGKWWTPPPSGGGIYSVTANLVFSAPDVAGGSSSGGAGFLVLGGILSAGGLVWQDFGIGEIAFGQGSVLGFDLHEVAQGGFGTSTTSGITFTANTLAPIPLPATGLLLVGALGGLGLLRRRKAA